MLNYNQTVKETVVFQASDYIPNCILPKLSIIIFYIKFVFYTRQKNKKNI